MSIAGNLAGVKARIGKAVLIAVSKNHEGAAIEEAIAAGQRVFGENRVQAAREKFLPLRARFPDVQLHLIGALQSNKAQDAVGLFDVIQVVDRENLVDALAKAMVKTGRKPQFYMQVNIGDEPQKAGVAVGGVEALLGYCRKRGVEISGLMCIPPVGVEARPFFVALRGLAERFSLPHVSMGMSDDFEMAVACGATEVRVGSAIFGVRA